MAPNEVKALLDRDPYEPIRVFMSDGSSFQIDRPELALVTKSALIIGVNLDADGWPSHSKYLNLRQITRIEPNSQRAA